MKMPPTVEIKREKKFVQLHCTCWDRLFAILLSLALSIFPSFSDVAEARSYFTPTVQYHIIILNVPTALKYEQVYFVK
jgi:hypothetical protein